MNDANQFVGRTLQRICSDPPTRDALRGVAGSARPASSFAAVAAVTPLLTSGRDPDLVVAVAAAFATHVRSYRPEPKRTVAHELSAAGRSGALSQSNAMALLTRYAESRNAAQVSRHLHDLLPLCPTPGRLDWGLLLKQTSYLIGPDPARTRQKLALDYQRKAA